MPASAPKIDVRISAKADEFTAAIASLRKELAALPGQAERSSRAAGGSISRFAGRAPDLNRFVSSAYDQVRARITGGMGALTSAMRSVPGLGALGGAASVAGLGEMVSRYASAGVELTNTARLAGLSAESLNGLRGAMRLVGGSAGDADAAMVGFNRTLSAAHLGANPEAAGIFNQLGMSMRDDAGNWRSSREMFLDMADRVSGLNNPLAAEQAINGVGLPSSMLPLMLRGRRGIEDLDRRVQHIYGSLQDYQDMSRRASDATADLGLHADKLGMTISSRLGPPMSNMLDSLGRFVEKHDRDIGDVFSNLGKAVEGVDWKHVGEGFENIGSGISFATRNAHALSVAMEALAANWAFRSLFGRGIVGAIAATPAGRAAAIAGALSGDTPGGGSGRRNTPEENAEIERRNAQTNSRYGYNGNLWHDLGVWWRGGGPTSRSQPGGPLAGWENGVPPSNDPRLPRGIRNNNPLNLTYVPGQQGVIGTDGRFGRYADMRDGVGSNLRQLLLYQDRDNLRTVSSMINRWAPPGENDTGSYVRRVAAAMGVDPNVPVNLHDPQQASSMIAAMAQVENGRPINPRLIREGVNRALGRDDEDGLPVIPGSNQPTTADRRPQTPVERFNFPDHDRPETWPKPPEGATHNIVVDFNGLPHGATVQTRSQGEGSEITGLNIKRAMPQADVGP